MLYAELTGSSTNRLPTHSPWSGGSNLALKLVTSLSRLLVPSNLCATEAAAAVGPAAGEAATGVAGAAARAPDAGGRRTPLGFADAVAVAGAAFFCAGTRGASAVVAEAYSVTVCATAACAAGPRLASTVVASTVTPAAANATRRWGRNTRSDMVLSFDMGRPRGERDDGRGHLDPGGVRGDRGPDNPARLRIRRT